MCIQFDTFSMGSGVRGVLVTPRLTPLDASQQLFITAFFYWTPPLMYDVWAAISLHLLLSTPLVWDTYPFLSDTFWE